MEAHERIGKSSPLLTVREAAQYLGQDEATIRRRIRQGELPALRVGSGPRGSLRLPAGELSEWLYREDEEIR